jgi:hypothetical protein
MKSIPSKGKLSLNKKAIARLDDVKMRSIVAGVGEEELAPEFTSIFNCSKGGFTCHDCGTFLCTFSNTCTSISKV